MSNRNYVTIIHPVILNSNIQSGGIETWIEDYLRFSQKEYLVLGVESKTNNDTVFQTRNKVRSQSIATIPVQRRFLPNLLRIAVGLALNRKLISKQVHVHRLELALLVRLLSPKSKIALFLHTDLKANLTSKSDSLWRFAPFGYRLIEGLGIASANKILVYSKQVKKEFDNRGINCELGAAWYDDSVFYKGTPLTERRLLVWVGRFERVKDPLLALEVFSKLVDESGIELRLYGTGSMQEDIKEAIHSRGLESTIKLMGNVSRHQLAEALRQSKAILQTSHFEGSPRVIVEAIACGAKVISTEGGDPEGWSLQPIYGTQVRTRNVSDIVLAVRAQLKSSAILSEDLLLVKARAASVVTRHIERKYTFD
jgi:glycosyltransferase involved in cell wall biosynthesis